MRSHAMDELEARAAEALREALEQVSTIKVRDVSRGAQAGGHGIVAHIDVLGHSYTLACTIEPGGELRHVEAALAKLEADAARLGAGATPVLIATCLSPEAQVLCRQSHIGFLDLEGNARLIFGEVFIVKRSLPVVALRPSSPAPAQRRFAGALPGFSPARAAGASGGGRVPACGD